MPLAARMQTAARVAVVAGAAYVADLWFNDDLSALTRRFRRKLPVDEQQHRPRVLVLGSGFGALNLVRRLHADQFQVTVVSPRNYFTFTPMLSRAMSGTVDASSITEPFRKYCRRSNVERVKFVEAEALSIHPDEKRVVCRDSSMGPSRLQQLSDVEAAADEALHGDRTLSLDYDYLVVAVGSEPRSFKVPGALEHGFVLRDVVDSQRIRNHVLDCFEAAAMPGQSDEAIDKLLHFVVVGGGFSGCEVCAAVPRRRCMPACLMSSCVCCRPLRSSTTLSLATCWTCSQSSRAASRFLWWKPRATFCPPWRRHLPPTRQMPSSGRASKYLPGAPRLL